MATSNSAPAGQLVLGHVELVQQPPHGYGVQQDTRWGAACASLRVLHLRPRPSLPRCKFGTVGSPAGGGANAGVATASPWAFMYAAPFCVSHSAVATRFSGPPSRSVGRAGGPGRRPVPVAPSYAALWAALWATLRPQSNAILCGDRFPHGGNLRPGQARLLLEAHETLREVVGQDVDYSAVVRTLSRH